MNYLFTKKKQNLIYKIPIKFQYINNLDILDIIKTKLLSNVSK
jgi:hypothetical protein